eukprot:8634839-Pyramimonas_sp.AAC.1
MVSSVLAILIASTYLTANKLLVVSSSSSQDAGRMPRPRVALLSFSEKVRGVSLVPVPGLGHCKQCIDSS